MKGRARSFWPALAVTAAVPLAACGQRVADQATEAQTPAIVATASTTGPPPTLPPTTVALPSDQGQLPMLLPGHLPDGLSLVAASVATATATDPAMTLAIIGPRGVMISVTSAENKGLSALPETGVDITVRGISGRYFSDASDQAVQQITWIDERGRLLTVASSADITAEELGKVAEAVTTDESGRPTLTPFGEYREVSPNGPSSWQLIAADAPIDAGVTVTIAVAVGDRASVEATAAFEAGAQEGLTVDAIDVAGTDAHLITFPDSSTSTLLWFGFGASVTISGNVSPEELVRIAERLALVDSRTWYAAVDAVFDLEITGHGTWDGGTWQATIGHDASGWCGEAATAVGDIAACEPADSGRKVATIWLAEPAPADATGAPTWFRLVGATTLGAATVELRDADGATLASADLAATDVPTYQAFALWPEATDLASADAGFELVLLDAAGVELDRHHLAPADLVDAEADGAATTGCPDPSSPDATGADLSACLFNGS